MCVHVFFCPGGLPAKGMDNVPNPMLLLLSDSSGYDAISLHSIATVLRKETFECIRFCSIVSGERNNSNQRHGWMEGHSSGWSTFAFQSIPCSVLYPRLNGSRSSFLVWLKGTPKKDECRREVFSRLEIKCWKIFSIRNRFTIHRNLEDVALQCSAFNDIQMHICEILHVACNWKFNSTFHRRTSRTGDKSNRLQQ